MKIAIITRYFLPYQIGGIEIHSRDLAEELGKLGHEVHIFTSTDSSLKKSVGKEKIVYKKYFTIHYLKSYFGIINPDLSKFDIIHIQEYFRPLSNYIILKWWKKTPILLTLHGGLMGPYFYKKTTLKYIKILHDKLAIKFLFKKIKKIITVSELERKILIKNYNVSKEKINLITNCISNDIIKFSKEKINVKPNINYKYILTIARLSKIKNIDKVIKILPYLPEDIHYLIVGPDDGELKYLKDLSKKMKLKHRVHFLGKIHGYKKYKILKNALVFILISDFESQPITILEAMFSGIPIITINKYGPAKIIKHKRNGFLCSPYDMKNLIRYIKLLYNNKNLWKKFSHYNLKDYKKYTWEKNINKILNIYKEILGGNYGKIY
ncbi:MAG: glycosyltransferase family 4 protein [Candidatus Woesearchaeota archaeon]